MTEDEPTHDATGTDGQPTPTPDHIVVGNRDEYRQALSNPSVSSVTIDSPDAFRNETLDVPASMTVHIEGDTRIAAITGDGIATISGRAHIDQVGGNLTVTSMTGRCAIGVVTDTAHVIDVKDRARIQTVNSRASVGSMHAHAVIDTVGGEARIGYVHAPARIGAVTGNARIEGRGSAARIGAVTESGYVAPRTKSNDKTTAPTMKSGASSRRSARPRSRALTSATRAATRFVRGEIDRELAAGRTLGADIASHEASR